MGWFIYGLVMGGGITVLAVNVSLAWYVWLLIALSLVMFSLTAQHYFGSLKEQEPTPARRGALALGVPALALAIAAIVTALV
jgi:hypothetical protein